MSLAVVAVLALAGCPSEDDDQQSNQQQNNNNEGFQCGPDTCLGCCDGDVCEAGNSEAACGGGGFACEVCAANEVCLDGACVPDEVPACSPESCSGCCNGDVCEAGTDWTACGSDGWECQVCLGSETCEAGFCVAPCGPDNCAGCCDAVGNCVAGDSDLDCGWGGSACVACGTTEACSSGVCIDASCQATCAGCCSGQACLGGGAADACGELGEACVDCGPGRLCQNAVCEVDPTSRWDVVLVTGDVPIANPSNAAWDPFGGLPDPYVAWEAGGVLEPLSAADSTVKANTITPSWNEIVLSDVSARAIQEHFCFQVWDDDGIGDDEITPQFCPLVLDSHFSDTLITKTVGSTTVRYRIRLH
jgi:hypothetical protein